jgi:hypothetical protein
MNTNQIIENKINEIMVSLHDCKIKHKQTYDFSISYRIECMKHTRKTGGLWMEFGVYRGRSLQHFAELKPTEQFYGFDCFEGLPEQWDSDNLKNAFNLNGEIPMGAIFGPHQGTHHDPSPTINIKPWNPNIKLIKGYFDASIAPFLETHTGEVDFIHLDADIYSSTKTVFDLLSSRITPNTMIMFDEINDYTDYRKHEIKAFAEFLLNSKFNYTCVVYQPSTYSQACFIIEE